MTAIGTTPLGRGDGGPDQLSVFLDYYLDEASTGDRAVLVAGPWGGGKTHYIKAYMAARDARRHLAEPLRRRHLYASLYGVTSVSDIADRLFAAAYPALDAWPVKLLASAATRAGAGLTKGRWVSKDDGPALKKWLLNLKDAVLVFDDLERAAMPVDQVLGFINDYVEHQGVKCVLIANEDEIDNAESYGRRKEKLIGWTIRVNTSVAGVIQSFGAKLQSPEARAAIADAMPQLVESFSVAAGGNYRLMKDILHAFDRVLQHADSRLRGSSAALANFLPFAVASGLELRTGGLKPEDLPRMAASTQELNVLKRRHTAVDWTDPVIPIETWGALLLTGQLDLEAANRRIADHALVVGPASAPAWRRLWDWRAFDNRTAFEATCEAVRAALDEETIVDPGVILHILGAGLDLESSGFSLFGSVSSIDRMILYAEALLAQRRLPDGRDLFEGFQFSSYDGLGFMFREDPRFIAFYDRLAEMCREVFESHVATLAPQLLDDLTAGRWAKLTEADLDKGGFLETPVLHHFDVEAFADLVIQDAGSDRTLLTVMGMRYRGHEANGRPFEIERSWLMELKQAVMARAQRQAPPFRNHNLEQLADRFERLERAFGPPPGPAALD